MPSDDGLGLDEQDGIRPAAPQAGEQDPEQTVGGSQPWPRRGALEDGQLVAQREVFEHQDALRPDPAKEAARMRVIMAAIIDQASRKSMLTRRME